MVGFSRTSRRCSQMVESHVKRRINYYLSSKTPSKLIMTMSDPAMMEQPETLRLSLSRNPVKHHFLDTIAKTPEMISPRDQYISLKLSRDQLSNRRGKGLSSSGDTKQASPHANYSKTIKLDSLDILYQICFAIHKYRSESSVSAANLCGWRTKWIRLYPHWFPGRKDQSQTGGIASCGKLFTRLLWIDATHDIGFVISAKQSTQRDESHRPHPTLSPSPMWDPVFYQIEVEEVLIKDVSILGLFEDFST